MSLLTFTITRLIPSDPARAAAGMDADQATLEAVRQELGLDQPLPEQYFRYVTGVLRGDLGNSSMNRQPVMNDIKQFLPASIELAVVSILMCVPLGVVLGIITALKAGGVTDAVTRIFAVFGVSMPVFWLALLFQLIFYRDLRWFPAAGRIGPLFSPPPPITSFYLIDTLLASDLEAFKSTLQHIILPAFTLAVANIAVITRMTRSSLMEVLSQDYVRTARAKGLAEWVVVSVHALKNAMVPVVTIIGLQLGTLIAWVFLVETIFSWPGIGSYTVRAIMDSDFNAVMGVTLITSFIYVMINLAVDVSYVILDPRIKY
ncbi:MAG: ABC transporter permease, partial [Chloroflexota bacterium]|nr:ABC transporter permease [Chloroflexota bacterium]